MNDEWAEIVEHDGTWWVNICVPFNDTFLWQRTYFCRTVAHARRIARRFPTQVKEAA